MKKSGLTLAWSLALALGLSAPAHADWALNMTQGITDISRSIYGLHMQIFWWCVAIGIFVFGWMILSLVLFRKSRGAVADTKFVHSTKMEIAWTIIPILILIIMAVPAARTLIAQEVAIGTELTIKVTGYQWKWGYEYVGKNVEVVSTLADDSNFARQLGADADVNTVPNYLLEVDRPLVVPAGVKVHLLFTAQDVIHAWWVPALAIKKDAVPGFFNESWFQIDADHTGIYRGQCAELCGRDHGFMPIVIDVRSKADFEAWIASEQAANAPAADTAPAAASTATAAT